MMLPGRWGTAAHSAAESAVIVAGFAVCAQGRAHAVVLFRGVVCGDPVGREAAVESHCAGGAVTEVPS